nr:MAG TPA: hypothetical protein [Caudoviricetes sp.]
MSLIDEIKIKSLSDAQEILKSAGTEDILDFEKAHKDGDLHPNGKYVWVSSANGGRGDWRTLNGRIHKKHQAANAAGGGSSSASSTTTGGNTSSVKTTISDGGKKKMINAKTNAKVVPDTYTIRGNRSSRKMDALYKEMDEKYKDYSREDLQKLKDSFDKKRTIGLAIDRYKQLTKQGAGKIAINKEGNLCDELTARYYTINRLLATEDVTNDVDNSKTTSSKSKKSSVKVDIDTIDQDEYNRMYKQAKSVDKQGRSMGLSVITSNINKYKKDLEETISNRPGAKATIKKLQDNLTKFISQKKAVEDAIGEVDNNSKTTSSINPTFQKYFSINNSKFTDPKKMSVSKTPQGNWSLSYEGKRISTVAPLTDADKKELESAGVTFDDTFKPKQKVKTNSETYSHDINGVSVNVSKNKDGSYTLEANGKKVKSDDPSFFKDKLTPRVKKALAKEVGIDATTSSKKTSSTNSLKSPSKVFKKISAKNLDELYTKTLSYIGGRIRGKINNSLVEGVIRNSKKKDDRVVLTVKKDDGNLMMISTSIRGIAKYQAPQPDASKIKEIKEGKKEVKISSAMGATDWSTLNYLINSGIEIQYQHGLSFRGGSNSSKKIDAEEALEKIHKNTTFDASVDGGVLYIHTYSGFDMD